MDPTPKMVIATALARRKGEIEVSTEQEIDELISVLIIAKTGLRGAASAIGAQGAMDAARAVEDERRPEFPERHADASDRERGDSAPGSAGCPDCGVSAGRHLGKCKTGARLSAIGERIAVLSTVGESGGPRCRCGHLIGEHDDADDSDAGRALHECLHAGCGCTRWRPVPVTVVPEAPRVVAGTVVPLRRDDEVVPAAHRPCPEAHPTAGTLCAGKVPHPMPHRDPAGREWVTSRPAVS